MHFQLFQAVWVYYAKNGSSSSSHYFDKHRKSSFHSEKARTICLNIVIIYSLTKAKDLPIMTMLHYPAQSVRLVSLHTFRFLNISKLCRRPHRKKCNGYVINIHSLRNDYHIISWDVELTYGENVSCSVNLLNWLNVPVYMEISSRIFLINFLANFSWKLLVSCRAEQEVAFCLVVNSFNRRSCISCWVLSLDEVTHFFSLTCVLEFEQIVYYAWIRYCWLFPWNVKENRPQVFTKTSQWASY